MTNGCKGQYFAARVHDFQQPRINVAVHAQHFGRQLGAIVQNLRSHVDADDRPHGLPSIHKLFADQHTAALCGSLTYVDRYRLYQSSATFFC